MNIHPIRRLARIMIITVALCASATRASSQDTLIMVNGDRVTGKVEEIGLDEIKYRISSDPSNILVVVAKREVRLIKLSGGREIAVTDDPMEIGYSSKHLNKTHAIKIDFLAPTLQHLTICYEQVIKPWMNAEVKVGWIGMGSDERTVLSNNTFGNSGVLAKVGVKFLSTPSYVVRGMRMSHPLKGGYIKPEIMFSTFSGTLDHHTYDPYGNVNKIQVHYTSVAFNMVLGWQSVLAQGFTFDMFAGLGYGGQWNDQGEDNSSYSYDSDWEPYAYSHVYFGRSFPLVFSTGMTMGWAF